MTRQRISSATRWEPLAGYSRAVRVGDMVFVSGTTATDGNGDLVAVGDISGQARQALTNIRAALEAAGGSMADVVRTRMYVTNIDAWEDLARVHAEFFGTIRPATTLVEVSRLLDPAMLVEIEADAVVESEPNL